MSFIRFDITKDNYQGIVVESKDNYFIYSSLLEKYYVYQKDHKYEVGDIISISSKKNELSFVTIESDFDFKSYLNKKGVYYELKGKINTVFSNPIRIKEIKNKAFNNFDNQTASILKAILFSDIDDNETISSLKELHLTRLLSTSGLYLSFFNVVLVSLLSLLFKKKYARLVSIIFFLIYNIFLFPKFSVIRFITFLIFRWINDYILKRKISYLSLISLVGLFFILIDFHLTYQISYILGFGFPIISYFIINTLYRYNKYVKWALLTLFMIMFTIPIDIYFYNELSIFSYLFQLLLSPLFIAVAICGFISIIIPIYPIIIHLIKALTNISNLLSFLSLKIYAPPFNDFALLIYYLLFFFIIFLFEIRLKPVLHLISLFYIVFLAIYMLPISNLISSEVSFINVGQGDACLIRKSNTTILIDTGGSIYKDIANNNLIPYLKKKRIYNIDLLITTHEDYDHMGARDNLMKNFNVKNYYNSAINFPISINGITLTNYNNYQSNNNDNNDDSLVVGFNLHNLNYLITGDAPISIEKKIMNEYKYIPCDILKVGHHGSNTSSSEEFIKYLNPKVGIISCGYKNKYGHPHDSVLKILKKNNVEIRRTDLEGTITYFSYNFLMT